MNSPQTVFRHSDIGPVPRDWQDVLFADIFEEYDERVSDTDQYPLYSLTIEEGVVPKTSRYERSFLIKKEEENYRIVHPNDFVYNPMNLRFGALARYKGEKPVCVSAYYDVFRAKKGFNSIYFEAFLTSYPMICYYNRMATGSLIEKQRVHFSQFCQFQLPVPSLPEQQKIADILSVCERVLTLKKELKAQKIKQKKWLMQKLLNPVSGVRLPGFMGEWMEYEVQDLVTLRKEKVVPTQSKINYKCIELEYIDGEHGKLLGHANLFDLKSTKTLFYKNDILFGKLRPYLRKVIIAPFDGVCCSEIWVFAVRPEVNYQFLYHFFRTSRFIEAANTTTGTKMPRADWNLIQHFQISLPSLAEQAAIAEVLSAADRELDLLEEEIQAWERKKKALSQLLLRGIVRV